MDKRFRRHCGVLCHLGEHLQRDDNSRKATDILMTFPNQPWKLATSGDYTCLCPFLISYIKAAASDFAKVLEDRAREKDVRHKAWCKATHNRDFVAGHRVFIL